jgi:hypothetical protein
MFSTQGYADWHEKQVWSRTVREAGLFFPKTIKPDNFSAAVDRLLRLLAFSCRS